MPFGVRCGRLIKEGWNFLLDPLASVSQVVARKFLLDPLASQVVAILNKCEKMLYSHWLLLY